MTQILNILQEIIGQKRGQSGDFRVMCDLGIPSQSLNCAAESTIATFFFFLQLLLLKELIYRKF